MRNTVTIFLIVSGVLLGILGLYYLDKQVGSETTLSSKNHPTQNEWLSVYITHKIRQSIDVWKNRVATNVVIFDKDQNGIALSQKEVVVTLVNANGEDAISQMGQDGYIQTAQSIAERVLSDYELTNEYKLSVQFVN